MDWTLGPAVLQRFTKHTEQQQLLLRFHHFNKGCKILRVIGIRNWTVISLRCGQDRSACIRVSWTVDLKFQMTNMSLSSLCIFSNPYMCIVCFCPFGFLFTGSLRLPWMHSRMSRCLDSCSLGRQFLTYSCFNQHSASLWLILQHQLQ